MRLSRLRPINQPRAKRDSPMVQTGGKSTMLGQWRVILRQAEEAAKAGRYDGVSYEVVAAKAYTPTIEGFVRLKVQKDRNGGIGPRGYIAAELHFVPNASGGTIVTFREPAEKQDGPWKPTAIMEKMVKHLETVGEANTTELRGLGGNTEQNGMAIKFLKDEGKIGTRKEGKNTLHYLIKSDVSA